MRASTVSLARHHPLCFGHERGKRRHHAYRPESLSGLNVIMTPARDNANGITGWTRNCNIQSDSALQQACEDVFRFDAN